jgi:hypothetical protein
MRYLTTLLFAALSLNAVGQIEWDFPYNPDADNDSYVSSTDLLELLALYGQEFSSDELYLSQDSTSLIVYVGDLDKIKCGAACVNLEGNWANLTSKDLSTHYDQLAIYPPLPYGNNDDVWMWYAEVNASAGYRINPNSWDLKSRTRSPRTSNNGFDYPAFHQEGPNGYEEGNMLNALECWCVTHQRPKVEWHRIENNDFESNKDELSQNGWRLHTIDTDTGRYLFWRWAE